MKKTGDSKKTTGVNIEEWKKTTGVGEQVEFKTSPIVGSYGWVCPVCGAGNAPWVSRCNCMGFEYKITCSSDQPDQRGPQNLSYVFVNEN